MAVFSGEVTIRVKFNKIQIPVGFSKPASIKTLDGVSQERLYNLEEDLVEEVDLSTQHPAELNRLKQMLDSVRSLR